jgi:hypothetical protein
VGQPALQLDQSGRLLLKYEPKLRSKLVPAEVATGYDAPDVRLDPEVQAGILEWLATHA